jgi:hypothetical protein
MDPNMKGMLRRNFSGVKNTYNKEKAKLDFINIEDNDIHKMLEMYDKEKDEIEDFGLGRTSSTCSARLSKINGKTYLHIVHKNPLVYGSEDRIYSYDMDKKMVCKISKIHKNISDNTYNSIFKMYCSD